MTRSIRALRLLAIHVALLAATCACVVVLVYVGSRVHGVARPAAGTLVQSSSVADPATGAAPDVAAPSVRTLLTQIIIIALAARLMGAAAGRLGQPAVIGEIAAGILLGPSLLGVLWPSAMAHLFPPASLPVLRILADVGVILFMFVVGMQTRLEHVRDVAACAMLVSHASIALPFVLGVGLALFIFRSMAPSGVGFVPFALFMGVGMSITAFPVLARILEETRLSGTPLGTIALTCAAVADAAAWCLLALVIAIVTANAPATTLRTIGLVVGFAAAMLLIVRPALTRLIRRLEARSGELTLERFAVVLALIFVSALATETIGIHSLFGAFLAGLVIPPRAAFRAELRRTLEAFTSVALLPIFFAYTGLRTQVLLVGGPTGAAILLAALAVAVAGKLGGSMLAARISGLDWRSSFALGALMNTRGLVELIVLNIGYDLGVLSAEVFAALVLVALLTTIMTVPLLRLAAVPPVRT